MTVRALSECQRAISALRRARTVVEPLLRETVARLPGSMRGAAEYQFGWSDTHGAVTRGSSGKGIRPALTVLCAEAVGGRAEHAAAAAVAVELVHNFSLVQDDVIDGDVTRRHRPTVWAAFGVPAATLTGSALFALAIEVLAGSNAVPAGDALCRLGRASLDLLEGQTADVEFESREEVGPEEYLAMARGKTAALMGCACELGALCGGADARVVRQMREFGVQLGLGFQMVDDLLGIWGDSSVTGKPSRSDLRARKKTFPVVLAMAGESPADREFTDLYRRGRPLGDGEIETAVGCLEKAGCKERTEAEARQRLGSALACLRAADPVPEAEAELGELARLAARRDH